MLALEKRDVQTSATSRLSFSYPVSNRPIEPADRTGRWSKRTSARSRKRLSLGRILVEENNVAATLVVNAHSREIFPFG